jgi:hypothetical protein
MMQSKGESRAESCIAISVSLLSKDLLKSASAYFDVGNEFKQRLGDHGKLNETSKLTLLQEKSGSSYLIKDRQESTFPSASQGELGIVGRLSQGCIDLYFILLEKVKGDSSFTQRESKIFERNYHVLLLWADGHEVLSGQLDGVLQTSKDLQRTILLTLNSLSEVICERKFPLRVFGIDRN